MLDVLHLIALIWGVHISPGKEKKINKINKYIYLVAWINKE